MKILFVRFSSLGDVILTTGIMNHLKKLMPDAQIDILTFAQYGSVFENLPFVNEVFGYQKEKGIIEYFSLVQREFEEHDYIIDLHGKLRSKFLKFHAQAEYHCYKKDSKARRAFVRNKKPNPRLDMHVVEKYFECAAEAFGLDMPETEALRPVIIRDRETEKGRIFVHPFASRNTKAYPYAKQLGDLLVQKGYTPVFAGMGDAPDVDGSVNLTGAKPMDEMLDIIASCEACISTDSGPLHAAVALNKPSVAIFGSTTRQFGFYPVFKGCAVLEDNSLNCRPCDVHGLDRCPKEHFKCMTSLTPELAVRLLSELKG